MFGPVVEHAAKVHALTAYPRESCGVVVGGSYVMCTNISDTPEKEFTIGEGPFEDLQGVIHSHTGPGAAAAPSKADMVSQEHSDVPWGIVATDGVNVSPMTYFGDSVPIVDLIGRNFIHGVYDCWGLVRDYYRLRGKSIINFPRDDSWWTKGEDMLSIDNFTAAGFTVISKEELRKGDVVAGNIRHKTINHVGIYMGSGLIMHHLYNRLSRSEPMGPWMKYCRYFLRYTG